MLPRSATIQPRSLQVIALVLAIFVVSTSSHAASDNQICDIRADYALGLEDYPETIALHRKLLQSHSDNALAHYHLGFAYGMVGDSTSEITEYLLAVRLGLNQWDLFMNLGLAYLDQEDQRKAIDALESAASLGPDHSETHFNLALAYERNSRLPDALREISVALRLTPQDLNQRNTRAIIYAELGDFSDARDDWNRLLRETPDYAPARANLAILNGSPSPALQFVQRAEATPVRAETGARLPGK